MKKYVGQGQAIAIFGTFLPDNIDNYPNVNVLSADMSAAASLSRFIYQNPDKFTEIGIAEQNLVGIAAGMASEGFTPIALAQAAFITMRAFEMDRQYLGYMKNKVVLVGLNSGFYLQYFGNTHYCIEDIAILRSIPNMTIISPADAGEAVMAIDAALLYDGPSYIRLTGGSQAPTVYCEQCDFTIGKNNVVRDGSDVCLFATGACVGNSLKAAEILSESYHIEAKVVDVHTLKPLDTKSVDEAKNYSLIVTAEEHSIIGGLGSAISDYTSTHGSFPVILKLGVKDTFSKPGDYNYLMKQHRLTPELIAEDIKNK
ncbi:MAG: transketolase, partial [Bacteroidaceae bacterium]|nr:transketolase [Bacteroidaceae bacterium]